MFRYQSTFDFQVRDQDVLLEQLSQLTNHLGVDYLPALAETIRRVGGQSGTLYLTEDLQRVAYWSTDEPADWPMGVIIAQWHLLEDHGGEVDRLG